ncbi:TauD/TfdA family dioxygenase [Amycolatopsis sp. CA-230715]|uniref:TauD/TfdA family dioxygenase n=1 Tax=Amycolatopsis sp. CA-230715 TaxID=2745196 RepID=UPI001C00BD87|nr:TauD/TfdA family dioxygenase [Amycolatopsis sp. CA-230715]QWF78228.1 hypothetical protein HUW46_01623 [Amycolatopsis sp. CA-230715]
MQTLSAALADKGIAPFSDVSTAAEVADLARTTGIVVGHRDSNQNGITAITARAEPAGESSGLAGFTRTALALHTDRSGITEPPHLLFVACARAVATGGECVTVDACAIYDDLARCDPEALADLSTPRTVLFGGAAGYLGAVFTSLADERIAIRLRFDKLAKFSPLAARHLPVLREVIDRHSNTFSLQPGEGYVLDNHRWLHGRRAFTGDRLLYRVHANPRPSFALPRGFRPAHASASNAA